jgi:hypothetical protein
VIDLHMPEGTTFERRNNGCTLNALDSGNIVIGATFTPNKNCKLIAFDTDYLGYSLIGQLAGKLGVPIATGTWSSSPDGYFRCTFSPRPSLTKNAGYILTIQGDPPLSVFDFLYYDNIFAPVQREDIRWTGGYETGGSDSIYRMCIGAIIEVPKGDMKYIKLGGGSNES